MLKVLVFGALLAVAAAVIQSDQAKAAETDSAVYVELRAPDNAEGAAAERWKLYGASYALVIGIDEYSLGWPRLSNAVKDAEEVAADLTEQGFEVTTLFNPSGEQLRSELRNFFALKGADPEARLFLWYAGHGYTEFGEGYLVPADAPDPSEPAFRVVALHLGDVGSMVRIARSKHVFAVFDSCFAGTIFNASRARPPAAITRAVAEPVRQFLTSGDADQEVSDDGSFRKLFLKALSGEEDADANGDGYLTGTEISLFLEDRVVNLTNSAQTPRSGKLRDQRFDLGDFVFLLPKTDEAVQLAAATPAALPAAESTIPSGTDSELTVELAFWDAIKNSERLADYRAYLTAYPQGRFAVLAEARAAELEAEGAAAQTRGAAPEIPAQVAALPPPQAERPEPDPIELAEQAELGLGLNRADRQELQAALTALGYDTRGVDGFFGPGTRDAIRRYQATKGAEQSGYLTAALASSLIAEAPKPEPNPEPAPATSAVAEPAQTQVAAVPQPSGVLPPAANVSKGEVERYFAANKAEMTERLSEYNKQTRLVVFSFNNDVPSKIEVAQFNVLGIENDVVLADVTLKSAGLQRYSGLVSATKNFLFRWTGSGLEIIRHLGDRETGSTAFATAISAPVAQTPQQQAPAAQPAAEQSAALASSLIAETPKPEPTSQPAATAPVAEPVQTQVAAVPQPSAVLPPAANVSKGEVERYFAANKAEMTAKFLQYNARTRVLLGYHGELPEKLDVTRFEVVETEGDTVLTEVVLSTGARSFWTGSETRDFLLRWTGSGLEIVRHLSDRETRSTAIATATSAVQAPQQQTPEPAQQPQPTETQTAALPPAGVMKEEVEAYVSANESHVKAQFLSYNERQRILLNHHGMTPNKLDSLSFSVVAIAGTQVTAKVTMQTGRGGTAPQSATREFILKWTGAGIEILGHR